MAGPVTNVKNLCSTEFTMEMSVTSQVVVMTMRFFIYPTHLDSREHVVIATLLNGMKNVLSSMKEVPLSHPLRRTECRLRENGFLPGL